MLIVNHDCMHRSTWTCMLLQVLAALLLLTWCIFSSSFPHKYLAFLDDLWRSEDVLHYSNVQPANGVVGSAQNLWAPIPPHLLGYCLLLPLPKPLKKSTLSALQQSAVPHVAQRDFMCTTTYIDNQELCSLCAHISRGFIKLEWPVESTSLIMLMNHMTWIYGYDDWGRWPCKFSTSKCQCRLIQRWTWHLSFEQLSWRSRECNTVTIENNFEYGSLN